jgi:hypothetical protein
VDGRSPLGGGRNNSTCLGSIQPARHPSACAWGYLYDRMQIISELLASSIIMACKRIRKVQGSQCTITQVGIKKRQVKLALTIFFQVTRVVSLVVGDHSLTQISTSIC